MKRAFAVIAVMTGAAVAVAAALTPTIDAEAAPGSAASSSPDAGAMSPYLVKAGTGQVLPPSIEDAEAFCALALACKDVPMFPPAPDLPSCVHDLMTQLSTPAALNASLAIRQCGLTATSCASLRKCALKGAESKVCDGVALESKEPIGKCDIGGHAVTCWRGKVLGVRDCELADELCVAKEGKAECALPGACPAGTKNEWSCAGTRMVKCQDGKFLSIDCKVLNLTCQSAPDATGKTVATCAPPTGASCKPTDKWSCSGTSAVGCVGGKEVKVSCGDQAMTCVDPAKAVGERTVGACEAASVDKPCDPKKSPPKCNGSAIEYCLNGAPRTFQCKSIGAAKCTQEKGSGPRCAL
jgi:hypothetical protein